MKGWIDELFFILFLQVALVIITGIDFIMHEVLYHYGLKFSYNWAYPYWLLLGSLFWIIALIGVSGYYIDRHKQNRAKAIGLFSTFLIQYHFGMLDTVFFIIERLRRGTWINLFTNWWWHPFSSWFGHWDLNMNIALNIIGLIILLIIWAYIKYRD